MSNIQHSTFNVQRAGWWRGRSHADAPDIDGAVYVKGVERGASERRSVRTGEFARVRIVGAAEYDLVGEVVG
jgi:ribosomal protein S12 methylthiotransferase